MNGAIVNRKIYGCYNQSHSGREVPCVRKTIYTIGYSGFTIGDFLRVLGEHGISALVDVRSIPYSRNRPEYNRDMLEPVLKQAGFHYRNYAYEFGARQTDPQYYVKGYLDFELFADSPPFVQGIEKLCKSMEVGYTFVLMCAEIEPINCHRAILVSRALSDRGVPVIHLLPHGRTITQEDLEHQLVDRYFPNHDQCSLFSQARSYQSMVIEGYQKRNSEIGYRLQEEPL